MSDEQMQPVLEEWFESRDAAPEDLQRSTRQVMAGVPQVRQRSRWWPLPLLQRAAAPPPAMPDTEYQPTPIPATNGYGATVTGRTMPMFSATKFVVAGALVFALGGVLLIAQPFDQQRASVPGAEVVLPASTSFTGLLTYPGFDSNEGTQSVTPGGLETTAWAALVRFVSSDPRLTGDATLTYNEVADPREGCCTFTGLWTGTYELTNDGGSWLGEITGFNSTELGMERGIAILVGQDGYDGLTAIFLHFGNEDWLDDGGAEVLGTKVSGVIFPSSMPEVPEPYAGE